MPVRLTIVKDNVRVTIGGGITNIPKMNYVSPIMPEDENEYVKKQIILAEKALDELKTKKIEISNITFYEIPVASDSNVNEKQI